MGEVAQLMLDGVLCERCGDFMDDDDYGFPRLCEGCEGEAQ